MTIYPYLPKAVVATTSAKAYMGLLTGAVEFGVKALRDCRLASAARPREAALKSKMRAPRRGAFRANFFLEAGGMRRDRVLGRDSRGMPVHCITVHAGASGQKIRRAEFKLAGSCGGGEPRRRAFRTARLRERDRLSRVEIRVEPLFGFGTVCRVLRQRAVRQLREAISSVSTTSSGRNHQNTPVYAG